MGKMGNLQPIWELVTKLLEMVKSTYKSGDKLGKKKSKKCDEDTM